MLRKENKKEKKKEKRRKQGMRSENQVLL